MDRLRSIDHLFEDEFKARLSVGQVVFHLVHGAGSFWEGGSKGGFHLGRRGPG